MTIQTYFNNLIEVNKNQIAAIIFEAVDTDNQTKDEVLSVISKIVAIRGFNGKFKYGTGSSHIWVKDCYGNEVKFLFE